MQNYYNFPKHTIPKNREIASGICSYRIFFVILQRF